MLCCPTEVRALPKKKERRQRVNDPEGTKRNIVEVGTREFAQNGFDGARVDAIANRTRTAMATKVHGRMLVGLIGSNIGKSLSPALHEDAFAAAGMVGHYHLMDVSVLSDRRLEDLLAAARTAGFAGLNITHPFKETVLPLLDCLSAEAAEIGAVNTVVIDKDGRTTGHNTDRSGFRHAFREGLGEASVHGKPVLLLGAGGAGRAVAFALMDMGASLIKIRDIDTNRANGLCADLAGRFGAGHSAPSIRRSRTSRRPKRRPSPASATQRRSACRVIRACHSIPIRFSPASSWPTSSTRRSKQNSWAWRAAAERASWAAPACACTRRPRPSGCSPASNPTGAACIGPSPRPPAAATVNSPSSTEMLMAAPAVRWLSRRAGNRRAARRSY